MTESVTNSVMKAEETREGCGNVNECDSKQLITVVTGNFATLGIDESDIFPKQIILVKKGTKVYLAQTCEMQVTGSLLKL